jgi:hypothetical protein
MLFANDDADDANDADDIDDANDADDVNDADDDVDDVDEAKANDNRSRKKKNHVSTLTSIESSGSWCDASLHH